MGNNQELNELKKQLVEEVEKLPEMEEYRIVKEQMNNHRAIAKLTRKIKRTQKELVQAKKVNKPELVLLVEEKIDALNEELYAYPIYQQFMDASSNAQEILNEISELVVEKLTPEQ